MNKVNSILVQEFDFHEGIEKALSSYPEKTVHEDGSVTITHIPTSYFLENDKWHISIFDGIKQFEGKSLTRKGTNKNIIFNFNMPSLNVEMKYIYHQHIFNDVWSMNSAYRQQTPLNKVIAFINEKYPALTSLLDLDIDKADREYLFWLSEKGINTHVTINDIEYKNSVVKNKVASNLRKIYNLLFHFSDKREEWDKDRWDVRELEKKYGISYNKTKAQYYLNFLKIHNNVREQVKKYIKQRLLSKQNFSWSTSRLYIFFLHKFFSFIFKLEPTWKDLKDLQREHILEYIEDLHKYAKSITQQNAHPEIHVSMALSTLEKFIHDIQSYEYDMAPEKHVKMLFFREDKPKLRKKSIEQIDHIPDYVLEQLFTHINDLNKDVIPVVWVAFKTGLRISDVLGLTQECLIRLNNKYYIETDIEKTYVKGHRLPIDDELANLLAVLIKQSKDNSNHDNNPEGYIFVRYRGARKGNPYEQGFIRRKLNTLAISKNITDENGNRFHFKTRQFRHTYAVKMLNGGADILTVQELLAHASPEMAIRYAKLLDDTKRKAFESVINQGVFNFDFNGEMQEIKAGEDIPEDILTALWQDHKLNGIDNPYGTCHARLNGNCPHMEAPPCLTCGTGGTPCRDLAVGFSEDDKSKYELHIRTTKRAIETAKQYKRDNIVEKMEKNLRLYEGILAQIQGGSIIFGRIDRLNRKMDKTKNE